MRHIPELILPYGLRKNPVSDPVESFVEDVGFVRRGGMIRIYCGEGSPGFYNRYEVVEALKDANKKKEAKIIVSTGPVVVTDESGFNALLYLRSQKVVDIFCRRTRGRSLHFRMVDAIISYRDSIEPYHPAVPMYSVDSPTMRYCTEDLGMRRQEYLDYVANFFDSNRGIACA